MGLPGSEGRILNTRSFVRGIADLGKAHLQHAIVAGSHQKGQRL